MILDTNAISDMIRGDLSLKQVLRDLNSVRFSPISLGEYRFGLRRSRTAKMVETGLLTLLEIWPCLPLTETTSECYAAIRSELFAAGTPISPNDIWLAAQAREHDLPVVTKDLDFDKVSGLRRQSW